jgi:glyoxylase-like metal-dependent hydrolase (beta-lactamase superfamily II)
MTRLLGLLLGLVVFAAGGIAVYVWTGLHDLEIEELTPDVHVIFGWGGNVAVLRTGAGAVVVDTMTFRMQGAEIRELAERVGGGPVTAIVNTHYHRDHTHGNPGFAPGTRVVATERTLEHLRARDADYWQGEAALTLPSDTFSETHELRVGDKTIRSFHLGRGHTDGDLVSLFVEDRVLVAGDLLYRFRYPNIDLEAGGSIPEWIATLDRVAALDFDRVVPGHGPITDHEGIRAFQDFLRELWEVGSEAAAAGLSVEDTLAQARLTTDAGFHTIGVPFVFRLDRDFVVRRAWQEATGAARGAAAP